MAVIDIVMSKFHRNMNAYRRQFWSRADRDTKTMVFAFECSEMISAMRGASPRDISSLRAFIGKLSDDFDRDGEIYGHGISDALEAIYDGHSVWDIDWSAIPSIEGAVR